MDKKKLIGTIIGVTLFAMLVAGATYAWLTFAANITNGNYVYQTTNFAITYEGGSGDLEGTLPNLTEPTSTEAKSMTVSAFREETTPNGILFLKVTSEEDNYITRGGAVNYAVCSGNETQSNCVGSLTTGSTGVLSTGSITNADETIIYQTKDPDLNPAGEGVGIPTERTYYWIYFWINPSRVSNEMANEQYKGFVHASAEQR